MTSVRTAWVTPLPEKSRTVITEPYCFTSDAPMTANAAGRTRNYGLDAPLDCLDPSNTGHWVTAQAQQVS